MNNELGSRSRKGEVEKNIEVNLSFPLLLTSTTLFNF